MFIVREYFKSYSKIFYKNNIRRPYNNKVDSWTKNAKLGFKQNLKN